jgi:hypothetical protein
MFLCSFFFKLLLLSLLIEINHKWLVEKIERIEKRFYYIYLCLLSTVQAKTARIVFRVNNLVIIEHYSNEKKTIVESKAERISSSLRFTRV